MLVPVDNATRLAFVRVVVYVYELYTSDESQVGRAMAEATLNVVDAGRSVHPLADSFGAN